MTIKINKEFIQTYSSPEFDARKVIIDKDLNIYSNSIARRCIVWLSTAIFKTNSSYDSARVDLEIAKKIRNWAYNHSFPGSKDLETKATAERLKGRVQALTCSPATRELTRQALYYLNLITSANTGSFRLKKSSIKTRRPSTRKFTVKTHKKPPRATPAEERVYTFGSKPLKNGAIGFINGINHKLSSAIKKAEKLHEYAKGYKIHGIHNTTHSVFVDVLGCAAGILGATAPSVLALKNQWKEFHEAHRENPHAKFLQVCHSGGAIHVYNALLYSPLEIRQRVIVLAIAPGMIVPSHLCHESHNYATKSDIVPKLDFMGGMRYGEQLKILARKKIRPYSLDHKFSSPTFESTIRCHVEKFVGDDAKRVENSSPLGG